LSASSSHQSAYQVLARKYRPQVFKDLIGQDHMVRVLRNGFEHDRIHHAFILTGVRGVGKTTTARIIAKGLNCTAHDKPTTDPCGVCDSCVKITDSTHVDVYEMDAASRTGVNDVREIIEAVRYRAASARYKVYIIDEVHMLSTQAFNALLKTLEEPPEHTKFIFATTDIHKIPVTVLSRCQRFDLKRIDENTLQNHLEKIVHQEGAHISADALALIARAAEGSVRDALSLLDQAVSQSLQNGDENPLDADKVRAMIGLADRSQTIDMFEAIMAGEPAKALQNLKNQYENGIDPIAVLRDLSEICHILSVEKVAPASVNTHTQATRLKAMAQNLSIRALNQSWQILLKALQSVDTAPSAIMAADMTIIQLTHAAKLPSPDDLMRLVEQNTLSTESTEKKNFTPATQSSESKVLSTFEDMLECIRDNRDIKLEMDVKNCMRIESFRDGAITFTPTQNAPRDLASLLSQKLSQWTNKRWIVSITPDCQNLTAQEKQQNAHKSLEQQVHEHPTVQKAISLFKNAKVTAVK
jgi:DNA polymerase III subunit gamma/tau